MSSKRLEAGPSSDAAYDAENKLYHVGDSSPAIMVDEERAVEAPDAEDALEHDRFWSWSTVAGAYVSSSLW